MLTVFQRGTSRVQYSTVSTIRRTEGRGGSMKVFWAINSLSMSFWMVPPISSLPTPCFSLLNTSEPLDRALIAYLVRRRRMM